MDNAKKSRISSESLVFFNDTATTEIYTLALRDALPICVRPVALVLHLKGIAFHPAGDRKARSGLVGRSEEHTSELQSRQYLVCRLLLEKHKQTTTTHLSCI